MFPALAWSQLNKLAIWVKPGSKRPGFDVDGETIVLRVRERAVDGAANAACIRALAGILNVAPSSIELVRGARSRQKVFAIAGLSREEALNRIQQGS